MLSIILQPSFKKYARVQIDAKAKSDKRRFKNSEIICLPSR